MKRLALGMAAALTLAACGGGGSGQASPTAAATTPRPTVAAATAAPTTAAPTPQTAFVFTAALRPTNEVPPITSPEASCTGQGTFRLNVTRDAAGAITAATAAFETDVSACPAGTAINIGHIHEGAAGANGPVKVNSGLVAAELTLTAGAGKINKTNVTVDPAVATAIIANPAGWYMNWHSTLHPGGIIRGQLVKS